MAGQLSSRSQTLGRAAFLAVLVASGGVVVAHPQVQSQTGAPSAVRTQPAAQPFTGSADEAVSTGAAAPSPGVVNALATDPAEPATFVRGKRRTSPGAGARRRPARKAAVSPTTPRRIDIPSIGVSAPIDPLGRNRDGTMAVPKKFHRTGYYTGRPKPGEVGPAIIVGHVNSKRGPAVFARLRDLQPGAEVVVARADGSRITFVIDRVEQHPKNAFPTEKVYGPTPDATLRLITCGGSFDRDTGHHRDNFIAFAHMRTTA